ncbi:MAG TPA: hypothetical protein VF223_18540 [Trebonia sp.]
MIEHPVKTLQAADPEDDQQRQSSGDAERDARQPRQRAAQPLDVDLKPGEEQQHAQPKRAQHLHRRVDARPAEDGRSDHDAEDDLQHRARYRQPGQQAEDDGNEDGDPGDDQHAVERHTGPEGRRIDYLENLSYPCP